MTLEICAYNIQSALIAEKAGADRIEFCADPSQGGITQSHGAIRYALDRISIPVFPMIGTRGGGYVFDKDELEIIKKDILFCKEAGCKGIATGMRLADGSIDIENLKRLTELAYPMEVTCHKAFDITPDLFAALEEIIAAGCKRILTSGGQKTAIEGADILAQLVAQAAGRIIIMPGGSVRSSNIDQLMAKTAALEFHSSGITNSGAGFIADEQEVSSMAHKVHAFHQPA
jgi:copper homeostasis protein